MKNEDIENLQMLPRMRTDDLYMFKINNRNTRTSCEICSKLTRKTAERLQWRRFGVFIVNFEHN